MISSIACNQNKEAITYDSSCLEKAPVSKYSFTILHPEPECKYPIQIDKIDTFLIVRDMVNPKAFLHLFSTSGKFIRSFGNLGNGPGEITTTTPFISDKKNKTIQVFNNHKVITYNIPDLADQKQKYFEEKILPFNVNFPINRTIEYTPDVYLHVGFTSKMRICITSQDSIFTRYYHWLPVLNTNDTDIPIAVMSYNDHVNLKPDKTKFIQATYIGAVFEIFSIDQKTIKPICNRKIFKPVYKIVNADLHAVSWYEDTTIGFDNISVTDNFIYTLLSGKKGEDLLDLEAENAFSKNITIFNWNGNVEKIIQTDKMLFSITPDEENNTFYGFSFSADNGFQLGIIKQTDRG